MIFSRRPLVRLSLLAGTAAVTVVLTLSATAGAQAASTPQTVFVTQSFTGATAPGYLLPATTSGTNVACLTASSDTSATVPGCASPSLDASDSGALRLTGTGGFLEGGIGSTASVPISKGLDAAFDSYQYGGSSADGIVFYLGVTDPYNPQAATSIGQPGGSLGYSSTGGSDGLAHGYLGLGLDVYGNYLNSDYDGTGCTTAPGSDTQNTNVTVRGPGNGSAGYCVLPGYNQNIGGTAALHGDTRADSDVPVEVVINPASTTMTSAGTSKLTAVAVAAKSYAIVFKTIGASSQTVVSGALPDLTSSAYSGLFPQSWFDPTTGLPYKLSYGWVASTGGNDDVHEVNDLEAQTLAGPVPVLAATSTVANATPTVGATDSYSVTPSVTSAGGSEGEPVRITTTFPASATPTAYKGTAYTCSISGHTETCTFTGSTAAGSALPVLTLPFTASGPASSAPVTISSVVSSVDASAVSTSADITVGRSATTLGSTVDGRAKDTVAHGHAATLVAQGIPAGATGTVTFTTATGAVLCTAALPATSCTTSTALAAGTYAITADYSGDTNHVAASAPALTLVVAAPATSASTGTSTFGSTVASSAAKPTVTAAADPAARPAASALAFTGSEHGGAMLIGSAALLALGAALVIVGRRRRRDTEHGRRSL